MTRIDVDLAVDGGMRKGYDALREHLRIELDPQVCDCLSRVVWELLTNARHAGAPPTGWVTVESDRLRIDVGIPGEEFDSVAFGCSGSSRGLLISGELLAKHGWCWCHEFHEGINVTIIYRG